MTIYQFAAVRLNEKGQCPLCKRKPLVYKKNDFKYCARCGRTFDIETGEQIQRGGQYRKIAPDKFERDCFDEEDLLEAQGRHREARERRRAQLRREAQQAVEQARHDRRAN
jgi:hypothetical protein